MKIGYVKLEDFWTMLKVYGLEVSAASGGHLPEDTTGVISCGPHKRFRLQTNMGTDMTFLECVLYIKTIQLVEDWVKYKVFA